MSNNTWGFQDIQHAREVVGYQPQDNSETFRSKLEVSTPKGD